MKACGAGAYGHNWGKNNLCDDCGLSVVSMINALQDVEAEFSSDERNLTAEIGYLFDLGAPNKDCRCSIKNLLSTGHDAGCPEKK